VNRNVQQQTPDSGQALPDAQARDRISTTPHLNVLVEAGAGSGKTHEMARRMAMGVATGAYAVEGMAAVTFTRKAAAELRGRFQMALEGLLDGRDGVPLDDERARARAGALGRLERFFAGTIHAFCAHLIRERPVEAGVAPGFRELDDLEDVLLRQQAWRDFVAQQTGAGHPIVLELREAGVRPADLDEAFGVVTLYEEVDFPVGDAPPPDPGPAWEALQRFWHDLSAKICRPRSRRDDLSHPDRGAHVPAAAAHRPPCGHAAGRAGGLLDTWKFEPRITQKCWDGNAAATRRLRDEIVALHQPLRDTVVQPFLQAWRQYLYRLVVTLLVDARGFAARERRRLNVLNYADLLQLAVRVLRMNPAVRRALQRKFRWLFVDEFQDTDPVQAEILFLLASDDDPQVRRRTETGSPTGARDPCGPARSSSSATRSSRSIASAAPTSTSITSSATASRPSNTTPRPAAGGRRPAHHQLPIRPRPVRLGQQRVRAAVPRRSPHTRRRRSRRSTPCRRAGSTSPAPAHAGSSRAVTPAGPVRRPTTRARRARNPNPEPRTPPGTRTHRRLEHRHVFTSPSPASSPLARSSCTKRPPLARYIRGEVEAGRRQYGDFLVLTRKKKSLAVHTAALEALEVPIEVSGAGAFRHSADVAQLALLLRALSDPQDAVALTGVLRGPLFGISDVDLFRWRQAGHWISIFAGRGRRGRGGQAKRASGAAAAWPERWPRCGSISGGSGCCPRLRARADSRSQRRLALAAATPGGSEAGDLLHAVDRVRQVVADGQTLADAAAALEDDLTASSEVESVPLEPGRTDVVRVMNLHKAKGLEAPVVFLADPCGGFSPRVDVRIVRDGPRANGYFQVAKASPTGGRGKVLAEPADWPTHEAEEQAYLQAEQVRLLYVAATRARDTLVVGRWAGTRGASSRAWSALEPFLGGASELPIPAEAGVPDAKPVDLSPAARRAAETSRAGAHTRALQASWSVAAVTADARQLVRLVTTPEPAADDSTRVVVPRTPSHRADAGMAWGTLVHGLLEHAMRHRGASAGDLRRLGLWLTVETPELRELLDEAIATVQAVANAGFWQEAQGTEHAVETPFAYADRERHVTTGVIDLLFRAQPGWQVIDYKTDVAIDPATAARYAAQLEAYRRALAACGLAAAGTRTVPVRLPEDGTPER
jgi:ATP-dependent helicase/nuclease subunit A